MSAAPAGVGCVDGSVDMILCIQVLDCTSSSPDITPIESLNRMFEEKSMLLRAIVELRQKLQDNWKL